MKIINIEGNKINACFSFVVANNEISVSTIFRKERPEIAIFDKHSGAMVKHDLPSISAAISWVHNFGDRD